MVKFIKVFNILLAASLLVTLGFVLGKHYDIIIDSENNISFVQPSLNQQKLKKLFSIIDGQYIKKVDSDSMMDATLNYILQGLDPHSVYLNSNQNAMMSDISGEFNGLGVEYYVKNDTITIIRNLEGSSNASAFMPGDKLLSINNSKITGSRVNSMKSVLDKETNYQIKLLRNGEIKKEQVPKTKVHIKSVLSYYKLNSTTGYLRLGHFSKNASNEVKEALQSFKNSGTTTIVLDVRDNGGGLLEEAKIIADEFLTQGQTIFYLKNEKDGKEKYFYATSNGKFTNEKIYLLINENSASASEVLAGALQDNDRATILGRRSFGKGLVQREIAMEDGSTFRLTTAKYYTPTGRCIQKNYDNSEEYSHEIDERYYNGELYDESKIQKIDSLKKTTPKGKVVYGGGGIIPDIFVPVTNFHFDQNFYLNDGGTIIKNTIIEDINENIPEYFSLNEEHYINNYKVSRVYDKIVKALNINNINVNPKTEKILKIYTKAYIGKILFGENAYFRIWNEQDEMMTKVRELLRK